MRRWGRAVANNFTISVHTNLARTAQNPMFMFYLQYTQRLLPEFDNYNRNLAARLTRRARKKLQGEARRPQERGSRPHARLTGRLGPAITGSALNTGPGRGVGGSAVGRGVGWPNLDVLDRRAKHWRMVEFGGQTQIPTGIFVDDVFHTYRDYLRVRGLSTSILAGRPSRRARTRAVGQERRRAAARFAREPLVRRQEITIEGRNFLTETWEELVGSDGQVVERDYRRIVQTVLGNYITS